MTTPEYDSTHDGRTATEGRDSVWLAILCILWQLMWSIAATTYGYTALIGNDVENVVLQILLHGVAFVVGFAIGVIILVILIAAGGTMRRFISGPQ